MVKVYTKSVVVQASFEQVYYDEQLVVDEVANHEELVSSPLVNRMVYEVSFEIEDRCIKIHDIHQDYWVAG